MCNTTKDKRSAQDVHTFVKLLLLNEYQCYRLATTSTRKNFNN